MAKMFDPTAQWSSPYPMHSQLAEALRVYRQYGVQNGYGSVDGGPMEKIVDGEIVETLQLEDKTNGEC